MAEEKEQPKESEQPKEAEASKEAEKPKEAEASKEAEKPKDSEESVELVGIGKKILVVDDEPTIVKLIEDILKKAGFDVDTAQNGEEAQSKIIEEFPPHTIIADIVMPKKDGFQFFKELKKGDITKDIPIIILSGRKNMEDSFLALGADAFIKKPIDSEQLLETVVKFSNQRASATESSSEKPAAE